MAFLKDALLGGFAKSVQQGLIRWRPEQIVDRPIDIDGFPGRVRFLPTFADRRTIYDTSLPSGSCPLCRVVSTGGIALPPGRTDGERDFSCRFSAAFTVSFNEFPYFNRQLLITNRTHQELFEYDHYSLLIEFMRRADFKAAALQLNGSGASIPHHVHISVHDEMLPLFNTHQRVLRSGTTRLSVSLDYPATCYKIVGGSPQITARAIVELTERILERNLSFNVYVDATGDAYVVPRSARTSISLKRKIGSSLPAGVYPGYVEDSSASTGSDLAEAIRSHCDTVTGAELATALRETVFCGDPLTFVP